TNITQPSNFYHLLRRQFAMPFRMPSVVMYPKSLLRHPKVESPKEEFLSGRFREVIDDPNADPKAVKKLLLCTGKVYYELLEKQEETRRKDVAIVRIEQLYPFPKTQVNDILAEYTKAKVFWVQEEPENMGAWTFLLRT